VKPDLKRAILALGRKAEPLAVGNLSSALDARPAQVVVARDANGPARENEPEVLAVAAYVDDDGLAARGDLRQLVQFSGVEDALAVVGEDLVASLQARALRRRTRAYPQNIDAGRDSAGGEEPLIVLVAELHAQRCRLDVGGRRAPVSSRRGLRLLGLHA